MTKSSKRVGSFATGYDQIPHKVWMCPMHGRVKTTEMVLSSTAAFWVHRGCGRRVEKVPVEEAT